MLNQRIAMICVTAILVSAALAASQQGGAGGGSTPPGAAQPSGEQREGPDGTMLPVLSRAEHTLVVEDLKVGEGEECERRSELTVHYHGTLADGTVFDTTRGKQPATFALNRLIPGWQAGVPGMKAGGVRRLVMPPAMGYGGKDRLNSETGKVQIPANSTLTFTIELVSFKTPPPAGQSPTQAGELKIEDLVVGTGQECPRGATVTMHYRGTLLDGTKFDASYDRNEPLVCSLIPGGTAEAMGVITGWQEGIPGMKVGGKRRLTIPPHMAYGPQGRPPVIPPNSTLVFEVELLDVK